MKDCPYSDYHIEDLHTVSEQLRGYISDAIYDGDRQEEIAARAARTEVEREIRRRQSTT